MSEHPEPLPPGPILLGSEQIEILSLIGRVGDGLVYAVRAGDRAARLREYAPAGIVQRDADGGLRPVQARFAAAWTDGAARFLEQAERLTRFDHNAVARLEGAFGVESAGGCVGAYALGDHAATPLASLLVPGQPLAPTDTLDIAAQIAGALAALHRAGITHLDIAPETVALSPDGAELIDFAIDNRAYMPLLGTQEGLVRAGYSPIEHHDASMADPLGPPADVHAASALLYRLITGREPPPWQERWRDPAVAGLAEVEGYPAEFLAAVRKGMAIEPGDRFADGAAWRDALGLGPSVEGGLIRRGSVPPPGGESVSSTGPPLLPPPAVPASNWLLPLALALAVVLVAVTAYLAYTQSWFGPAAAEAPIENKIEAAPPIATPPPPVPAGPPAIRVSESVTGRLAESDLQRGAGQYQDRFTLDAQGGERLEILLSSSDFDPLLMVSGPDLAEANDDDPDADTRDSRLVVTLPRAGRYTITVTSYDRGETGAYLLEVRPAPAAPPADDDDGVSTIDLSAAARLAGRWRGPDDPECEAPAVNRIDGDTLVSNNGLETFRHHILTTGGDAIETEVAGGRLDGRRFTFRLSDGGKTYSVAGERWTRC